MSFIQPHEKPAPLGLVRSGSHGSWPAYTDILSSLPLPFLLVFVAVLYSSPGETYVGGIQFLPVLNTLFSAFIALLVLVLTSATFLAEGVLWAPPLGMGMLIFSISSVLAGVSLPGGRVDTAIAIYNSGMLASGLLNIVAAVRLARPPLKRFSVKSAGIKLLLDYLAVLSGMVVFYWLITLDTAPTFFIEGSGPTPLRQLILAIAIASFAVASAVLLSVYTRMRSKFCLLYGIGLACIAAGLWGVFGIRTSSSLLAWVGRGAQYIGGIYLLSAVISSVRKSGGWSIPLTELYETHMRHSSLIHSMPDAILVLQSGKIIFANPAAETLLGMKKFEDLLGQQVMDFVGDDSTQSVAEQIRDVLETGETGPAREVIIRRPDGGKRIVELICVKVFYSGQEAVKAVLHDVTDRKHAEEGLRKSEEMFRAILENSRDGIHLLDLATHRYVFMSPSQELLTGFSREELNNLSDAAAEERLHPEDRERVTSYLEQVAAGEHTDSPVEYRWKVKSGEYRWFSDSRQAIRDESGKAIALVGVSRDISREKQMIEEQENLRIQAEAANRAKSEFLAHMSHELRTPISGMTGMIDILLSRIGDEENKSHLKLIRESAQSLLSVVGDVLDLSRIESGKIEVEDTDCDIHLALEQLSTPFRLLARNKGLSFSLKIAPDLPRYLRMDGEKAGVVMRNLISNAVKYTDRGSITVGLSGNRLEDGRIRLCFSVQDTGPGIPAEKLDSIFESFVRVGDSLTSKGTEGTGLGLTISKRMATVLGGTLSVESTVERGSNFGFFLDVTESVQQLAPRVSKEDMHLSDLPQLSILVAEDNRINQMFIEMTLTEAGHTVTVAENGKDAVEILSRGSGETVDFVLMDVQMPIMDGIEATRLIRCLDTSISDIPVIALTAFAMKGDEERFLQAGMNGYVTKPIDWDDLTRVVLRLLQEKPRR